MRLLLILLFIPALLTAGSTEKPYFQQEVHYKIKVALNDRKHTLRASEELEYINRSTDTLTFIWFHLWPNAYKERSSALCKQQLENGKTSLYFAKDFERGYIDSLHFTADGDDVKIIFHEEYNDVCKLVLNKPLLPGQRTIIRTPFFVKIPSGRFSRMGHLGQAYAITQWYPKPAVYDHDGWHPMPYLNEGEFYSEFGSYDVSITLPRNYVVGATGDLPEDDHEYVWMSDKANETKRMTAFSNDMSFPESDPETKTLNFHQNNVHDFAWFADKRYHVLKGEVILPRTQKKVTTWALFTNNEAGIWMKSIEYINDALSYLSKWNGDYPYNQCTAVDGTIAAGGGMEYPNVTIVGTSDDAFTLETTLVHEVGHNWFYGMLGSNERDHPWMDEGINSFNELRYVLTKYPPATSEANNQLAGSFGTLGKIVGLNNLTYDQTFDLEYQVSASSHTDQPIEELAKNYLYLNYGTIVYSKTGLAFHHLKNFLGDELFDKCMQQYFTQWCYHHPYPADLEKIFRANTDKNLDWFFNKVIKTKERVDYGISKVSTTANGFNATLKQDGDIYAPVKISGFQDGKSVYEKWIHPETKDTVIEIPCKTCDEIIIDPEHSSLDVYRPNNQIKTKGLFKKLEPISLNFFAHTDYPTKTRLFWMPVIAWNNYNKFMTGIVIHNKFYPYRKFEFSVLPMYGFGDNSFAGTGEASYHFYPEKGKFYDIIPAINARRFAYLEDEFTNAEYNKQTENLHFFRVEPSLTFLIRPKDVRSTIRQQFKASAIFTNTEITSYTIQDTLPAFGSVNNYEADFYRLAYRINDKRAIDPWNIEMNAEGNNDFSKISATLNYRFTYTNKKKGFDVRFFGGYMFKEDPDKAYGFALSDRSATRGSNDYAYDELYLGRSEGEGFLFQQMALRQGAFKIYNPLGSYRKWVAAINLKADLPIQLPIGLYADIGTYNDLKSDIKQIYNIDASISYDGGIYFSAIAQVLEIYFPLFKSSEINKYLDTNNIKFKEQIRFVFNLQKLNPLKLRNQIFEM